MRYAPLRTQAFILFFMVFFLTLLFLGSMHDDVFAQSSQQKKMISDRFMPNMLLIEQHRCKIKKKTVVFYVDNSLDKKRIFPKVVSLCKAMNATSLPENALDVDGDGRVEVRIGHIQTFQENKLVAGKVVLNNMVQEVNRQRDIIYVNATLFLDSRFQRKDIEETFLHESHHLRQHYLYYCSTMKKCHGNDLNTGKYWPAQEVQAFIEGDAVRASCEYLRSRHCPVINYTFSMPITGIHSSENCFTALHVFGYNCAYYLVEKINSDFNARLKTQYKNKRINPMMEVLKTQDALQRFPNFKKALDDVFKKYTTIGEYNVYEAERVARCRLLNCPLSPPSPPSPSERPPIIVPTIKSSP